MACTNRTLPILNNPTKNERALWTWLANPCLDFGDPCIIPPILNNPNPCELALVQMALGGQCKLRPCLLMSAFPSGCSPNLEKLILFTNDVISPEVILGGVPPVVSPCVGGAPYAFDSGFILKNEPEWFGSTIEISQPVFVRELGGLNADTLRLSSGDNASPIESAHGVVWWSANSWNDDQSSEAVMVTQPLREPGPAAFRFRYFGGLGVRQSGTRLNYTGYCAVWIRTTVGGTLRFAVFKLIGCSLLAAGSCATQIGADIVPVPTAGDLVKLKITGSISQVLDVDINGFNVFSSLLTIPTIASGNPGFVSGAITTGTGVDTARWDTWCGEGFIP